MRALPEVTRTSTSPIVDPNQSNREVTAPTQYYIAHDVEPSMFNTLLKGYHIRVNYGAPHPNQLLGGATESN